jgi:membrane protein YqaA with SNARE-associated domain
MNTDIPPEIARAIQSIESTISKESRKTRRTLICLFTGAALLILFIFRPDLPIFNPRILISIGVIAVAAIVITLVSCGIGGLLGTAIGKGLNQFREHKTFSKWR